MDEPAKIQCGLCQKTYATDYLLRLHQRRVHASFKKWACYHCEYSTNHKHVLKKHITRKHLENKKKSTGIHSCPLCNSFKFANRCDILKHYDAVHNVSMSKKNLQFHNSDDFQRWKREIELRDSCQFVVARGERKTSLGDTKYFRCSRDGFARNTGKGQRRPKIKGSVKTNAVGPSSITVQRSKSGMMRVKYVETHVGHTCDIGRLQLSEQEKNDIVQKLAANVSVDAVLDSIRGSVCNGAFARLYLTTRKDLLNLKRRIQLKVFQEHEGPKEMTIVGDLSAKNRQVNLPGDIEKCREILRMTLNQIVDSVQTVDHYRLVLNAITPLTHTLDPQRRGLIFSSTSSAVPKQINPLSPQKRLF